MKKIKTGGAAFPRPCGEFNIRGEGKFNNSQDGMTLRDYFAAKAMQGLLANPEFYEDEVGYAYKIADAMLAERERGE